MPKPKLRTNRRRAIVGTRVLVCGHPVSTEHRLICLLPTDINHTTHVSMAVTEGNGLVIAYRLPGKRETEWQVIAEGEGAPSEQSMSREQQ